MSREIKFRAWIKQDPDDRSGDFMMYHDTGCEFQIIGDLQGFSLIDPDHEFMPDDSFGLMQYTGLKDKNGVEIYEGDIVKCKAGVGMVRFIGVVTYEINKSSASIDGVKQYLDKQYHLHNSIALEVLGNIHENPELLTK